MPLPPPLLPPRQEAIKICKCIRLTIRKSIKKTNYRFSLLLMGLLSSLEYSDIEAPADVEAAWTMLRSSSSPHSYTEDIIMHTIRNVHDQDLISLIVHGIFYYDIENNKILDCDDNDIIM